MTGIPWLRLALAGAYTFTLAGLLIGTYAYLMDHTELPTETSIRDAALRILGFLAAKNSARPGFSSRQHGTHDTILSLKTPSQERRDGDAESPRLPRPGARRPPH